jgi:hypothetical protein|nr:MAG TPA: hypothetical protein [Caudoviricetes sp.]
MEQQILEALQTKFPGVSTSILGRMAKKLAKTVTTAEQVKTATEGVTIQQVIESYGDSRATEASNTARENAVKDYESRYGLKDGVKTTTTTAGGEQPTGGATNLNTGGEEVPAWAQKLIGDIAELKASKTTETRTQQLHAVIGKLPESMRKAYERLPVDKYSADEFSTLLGEITTEVEGIADDTAARGGVFGKPSASQGIPTKTELTEAQKAAISHREGIPANGEQPF